MKHFKTILAVITLPLLLGGCQSTKTYNARMAAIGPIMAGCQENAIAFEAAKSRAQPIMTGQEAIIYVLAKALSEQGKATAFSECNKVAIVSMETDARVRGSVVSGVVSLGGLGIGAWAASDMVKRIAVLGGSKGGSTVYSNSRVLDAGSGGSIQNSSASGQTLNIGDTVAIDSSDALGGIQPRQSLTVGDGNTAPSQSGTAAPITNSPGDGDEIVSPLPEVLPVE